MIDDLVIIKSKLPFARVAFEMQVEAASLEVTNIAKQISSALGEASLAELKTVIIREFIDRINEPHNYGRKHNE